MQLSLEVVYLATSQASDAEMAERILRHQRRRPSDWKTVEEPLDVAEWIATHRQPQIVLLDCLSLLLNNWMFLEDCTEERFFQRMDELRGALSSATYPIIVVSNEVGHGIVPGDAISRRYRDWLGLLNQTIADISEKTIFVVAGIPVDLKKFRCNDE
jgi:adenosylcobinamide kinase/adenosylcobinamide-phosphate guanylyltransferase